MSKREQKEKNVNKSVYRGVYHEIAEDMGVEVAEKMFENYAGLQMNFPKRLYTSEYYAERIVQDYQKGMSVQAIAKKYHYTERRIRQILEE